MYVQHEPENRVCQRIGSCETDFASSITFGETGSLGSLTTFFCPQEVRENRTVTGEESFYSHRGCPYGLDFTKCTQEPVLLCKAIEAI
jgi:hypothetical protein